MARQLVHIEPDPALAEEVRRAFAPAGFSIVNLTAGESAVERCKAARPDLILLAAELPDMSGFSVCNRLKRAFGTVPVILYSAEATPSAIEAHRATRTRADEYLAKPFEIADLLGRAAHLLEAVPPSAAPPPATPARRPEGSPPDMAAREGAPPPVPRPGRPQTIGPATPPAAVPPMAERPRVELPLSPAQLLADPFAEAPRDPAPPKGTPEQKLEFFRERLRARDAFLARVKESYGALRAEVGRLGSDAESHQAALAQEAAQRAALEERQRELETSITERDGQIAELERKLGEVDSTRQSLSEVLTETMQQHEVAEQQWSARLAAAEEERARLESLRQEERQAADEDRNRLESQRQDDQRQAEEELSRRFAEWQNERSELDQRLHQSETERDELASEVKRLEAKSEHDAASYQEWKEAADRNLEAVHAELDSARTHSEAQASELAELRSRVESADSEAARHKEELVSLQAEVKSAKAEATAYAEKAVATEQAYLAQGAELETARRRNAELAAALDEGRASAEGVRGQVTRLQEELSRQARQMTQVVAERKQLDQEIAAERQAREEAQTSTERLQTEVARLRDLETQASDSVRLRRELALAQEVLQQRTQQLESAARSAHDAVSERERVREKLELEIGRLSNDLARRESEAAALRRRLPELEKTSKEREEQLRRAVDTLRRRITELEQKGAERDEQLQQAMTEAEKARQARVAEVADNEKRQQGDAQRLKAALVELERRLESSIRNETQLRKRVTELEKTSASATGSSQELELVRARLQTLQDEYQDLRSENDFLNTEVARFHQKNQELQAKIQAMEEI